MASTVRLVVNSVQIAIDAATAYNFIVLFTNSGVPMGVGDILDISVSLLANI